MAHNRKLIRHAVKDLLIDNTSAGPNVYPNRETNLWESELPAILIYTKDEPEAQPRAVNSQQYIRKLTLFIEIKTLATETVDDDLDDLAEEVESIIRANPNLNSTATSVQYKGTEIILDATSETEKGVAILTFEVQYIH